MLALTVRVAVSAPAVVGANSTATMQLALAARVAPQLLAVVKDPAPVPLTAMGARFTAVVVLLLVRVTSCAELTVPDLTVP